MLSYLHGFHAGNAADVLKHSVLIRCVGYLKKKPAPLLCVDTHAGAGFYDPVEAREWEKGAGRLLSLPAGTAMPPVIAAYIQLLGAFRPGYPGSPLILAEALEKGDRLVCFELHPREFETLKASLGRPRSVRRDNAMPAVEARREDGPENLKTLLPPPSRRGLVFIDPAWEEENEYERVPSALRAALKRFPGGTFIVWYPLLAAPKGTPAPIRDVLYDAPGSKRCRAEIITGAPEASRGTEHSPRGMYGSGLAIFNPPWTLKPALEESLPWLAGILGGKGGGWRLDWDG
jgi:23S rRNA (adenine2030-N6)-methyltransferase